MRYLALLYAPAGPGNWSGHFPDLPGCVATGRTFEDVCAALQEALTVHLAGMREDGDPAPPARSFEDILADPEEDVDGAYPALIIAQAGS